VVRAVRAKSVLDTYRIPASADRRSEKASFPTMNAGKEAFTYFGRGVGRVSSAVPVRLGYMKASFLALDAKKEAFMYPSDRNHGGIAALGS